jgi:transcriptional regulator with XRE-family HTH domain
MAESLRTARQELGWTQAEVAADIGVATEVYGRMERGLLQPSVRTLRKLAIALRVPTDTLLGLRTTDGKRLPVAASPAHSLDPGLRYLYRKLRGWAVRDIRALMRAVQTIKKTPPLAK